jgi:hypothetical protein
MNQRFCSPYLVITAGSLILLSGCQKRISTNDLNKIRVGMSKNEVIKTIGKPTLYRGSMINEHNEIVDVFEYTVDLGSTKEEWSHYLILLMSPLRYFAGFAFFSHLETYWFIFYNDTLSKWCKAGDWNTSHDTAQNDMRISQE